MSDAHAITAENLLRTLPDALKNDSDMIALASTISDALAARPAEIKGILIYPRMGELDENLLDILAYDLKVDWYDYSASLDVKREVMLDAPRVRRTIGTPGAVKRAIRALLPNTELIEWFDDPDGAEPYTFRLISTDTITPEIAQAIPNTIAYIKNVRSHLTSLKILREYHGGCYVAMGMYVKPRIVIHNTAAGEWDTPVVVRSAVGMQLTPTGKAVLNSAQQKRSVYGKARAGAAFAIQKHITIRRD